MTDTLTRRIRETTRLRRLSTVVAILLGLSLATMHWLGLVAGGMLVALPAKTSRHALVNGLVFGVLALVVFLGGPLLAGTLSRVLGTGLPAILAIVSPLVLSLLGALVRAIY
jgi:NO-binding membrane sensor protein with MHYT domain